MRILLIDSEISRARALERQLRASGFDDIVRAPTDADLAKAVEELRPDLVIVDMALPDRDALEGIRAISAAQPIVMFGSADDPAFAEDAIAAGVCSYNLSGVALGDVKAIMRAAIALFRRHRHVETQLAEAQAELDDRRMIERAKALLMRGRKLTEPQAHRFLQKTAMDRNLRIAQVAGEILRDHDAGQGNKT